MSNQKNQHFVPKVYLKQFSADGKSIELCIKKSLEFIPKAAIKNQSSSNYFYGKDLKLPLSMQIKHYILETAILYLHLNTELP